MGEYTESTYYIICDVEDCYEESPTEHSEHFAQNTAIDEGWVRLDGMWFCPKHAKKARKGKEAT